MQILVFNAGSSSLKYQLIDMATESPLARGIVERIGIEGSNLCHKVPGREDIVIEKPLPTHGEAIREVLAALTSPSHGVIDSMDKITAVAHRVVHGGDYFTKSTKMTPENIEHLRLCSDLAPLHNPAAMMGIEACMRIMPNAPQIVGFDTSFHQTMPAKAYMYAVPYELYSEHKVRRYGFHGTSHRYVANKAAELLGKPIEQLKMVTVHLGGGASLAAVDGGRSVDTSMGFTPLAGIPMGTRSGDIDPAIVAFMAQKMNLTADEAVNILNKESGVKAVSGISSDFRDLWHAQGIDARGNADHETVVFEVTPMADRAALALDMFTYGVKKYIGAYAAAMGGLDAIVFTAGIGENDAGVRAKSVEGLEFLGVAIDREQNRKYVFPNDISAPDATVQTLVIATNEELMLALDTKDILEGK